jgi:hypothetical protein
MEELYKKLTQLSDLLKAMKKPEAGPKGPSIPTLPSIKPPPTPSMSSKAPVNAKMPGMSPTAKKDPKKIAQQIKDGSMSTKTQKVMLKVEKNGQWSLD